MNGNSRTFHASAVSINGNAVIISGPSGIGKTQTCLELIDRGAVLIADDQSILSRKNDHIMVSCKAGFEGKIELYNIGIINLCYSQNIPLALWVMLNPNAPRFPSIYHGFDFDGLSIVKIEIAPSQNIAQKIELCLKEVILGNIIIGENAIGG